MHIRASLFTMHPFAFAPTDESKSFTGPIPTMIEAIAERINITYDISMTPDGSSVSFQLPNGSWTSLRGMIERNQTDIVWGPEMLIPEQLEGMRIGNHYLLYTLQMFASAGDAKGADFSNIILAFDHKIWYTLMTLLVVLTFCVSFFDIVDDSLNSVVTKNKMYLIEMNFWMFLASFFLEGTPRMPSLQKNRFVFGIWLTGVMIMMNAFSGQFKTALMVKGPDDTMYSIKDLSERPNILISFRKGGCYAEQIFQHSSLEEYQQVWENIEAQGGEGLKSFEYFYHREIHDKVKAGKATVLSTQEIIKNIVQDFCPTMSGNRRFYFIREPLYSNIFTFYASPTFPEDVFNQINKRVRWIVEGNIFNRWVEVINDGYSRHCLTAENAPPDSQSTQGLTFDHILPAVFVMLAFQGFAVFVLLLEIVHHFLN